MANVKIISEDEYDAISNDLALFIGKIEKLEKNFDPKRLRFEIIKEFKIALKQDSINLRKIEEKCDKEKDMFLILYFSLGIFIGTGLTLLVMKLNLL